jgi:putative transcriptional regulator
LHGRCHSIRESQRQGASKRWASQAAGTLARLTVNGYAEGMIVETELAAPAFLIAVPQLGDPNFNRGVVLVIEHGEQGSMGLILNRPTDLNVTSFCQSQNMRWAGDGTGHIFQGGPVQTERAFILHASEHQGPETESVVDQVRLSYSLESLKLLADRPPNRVRIYLGYAGWGPGQLAEELTGGAWLLGSPSDKLIFETAPDRVWELALHEMGIDPVQLMHSGALH